MRVLLDAASPAFPLLRSAPLRCSLTRSRRAPTRVSARRRRPDAAPSTTQPRGSCAWSASYATAGGHTHWLPLVALTQLTEELDHVYFPLTEYAQ